MLEGSQATEFEVAAASEKQVERRIVVPSELVDPHSLVVLAEKSLRHGGRDANGLLKPRKPGRLNMQVSRECLDRALGIMDALLKALEGRGYAVSVGAGEKSRTIALVLGEEIGFWIEEVLDTQVHQLTPRQLKDKEKNPWRYSRPEYDHTPSGRLALKIGAMVHEQMRRTWADAGKHKVETCLNGFIVGMIRAAERQRAERLEREREEAERQERERKRLDEERRQAEERQRAERLKQHIDDWSRSRKIREYVAEMKASALQPERWNVSTIPLPEWLEWALNYADSIDPVTPLRKDRQAVNTSEEASRPTVVDRRASE